MRPAADTTHPPISWVAPQQVLQTLRRIVAHPAVLRILPVRMVALVAQRRNRKQAIARVPLEIWDIIVSYLHPISAACLAFTSTTLFHHLGRKPWNRLKRRQKVAFVALLEPNTLYALLNFYEISRPDGTYPTCRWTCKNDSPCHALSHQEGENYIDPDLWPSYPSFGKVNLLFPLNHCENFDFWQVRLIMDLYRNTPDGSLSLPAINHAWTTGSWDIHTDAFFNRGKLIIKMEMLQRVDPDVDRDFVDGLPSGKEITIYAKSCVQAESYAEHHIRVPLT